MTTNDPNLKNRIILNLLFIIIYALFFWVMLSGCSASKRLNRLLKNNPELATIDTTYITDTTTFFVPGVRKDTTIIHNEHNRSDTTIIKEKHLTIWHYRNGDTSTFGGSCDPIHDTIIKTIPVPYEKFIYKKPRDALIWGALLLSFITLIVTIYIIVKKESRGTEKSA
jgi:hypothetical protein